MTQDIRNLFESNGLNTMNEVENGTGLLDIYLGYNLNDYKIELDILNLQIKVFKKNKVNNPKKCTYYRKVRNFFGKDAWKKVIEYIKTDKLY